MTNQSTEPRTENSSIPPLSLDIGPFWELRKGSGPLIGVALHAGHNLRSEIVPLLVIDEETRFREEDPYSDYWTPVCGTQILTLRSRFEVDLNRSRDQAVYQTPADSWGVKIWSEPPSQSIVKSSLAEHDRFYAMLKRELNEIQQRSGHFVILDFHSYNHRRQGAASAPADPELNPEINIGTGSMKRENWSGVVDGFINTLGSADFLGRKLDVRENVNFKGRYLAQFVHHHFPDHGCVLAIEVKKFFMDEWSGLADTRQVVALREIFRLGATEINNQLGSR